jgi:hypothetical protein
MVKKSPKVLFFFKTNALTFVICLIKTSFLFIMNNPKFKTKREFIEEIGLSKSTFYRLVQKKNIQLNSELLSPKEEQELRNALGFPSEIKTEEQLGQIWTDWDRLGQIGTVRFDS